MSAGTDHREVNAAVLFVIRSECIGAAGDVLRLTEALCIQRHNAFCGVKCDIAADRQRKQNVLAVLAVRSLKHEHIVCADDSGRSGGNCGLGCCSLGCCSLGCRSLGCRSLGCRSLGCRGFRCCGLGCRGRGRHGHSRFVRIIQPCTFLHQRILCRDEILILVNQIGVTHIQPEGIFRRLFAAFKRDAQQIAGSIRILHFCP